VRNKNKRETTAGVVTHRHYSNRTVDPI